MPPFSDKKQVRTHPHFQAATHVSATTSQMRRGRLDSTSDIQLWLPSAPKRSVRSEGQPGTAVSRSPPGAFVRMLRPGGGRVLGDATAGSGWMGLMCKHCASVMWGHTKDGLPRGGSPSSHLRVDTPALSPPRTQTCARRQQIYVFMHSGGAAQRNMAAWG